MSTTSIRWIVAKQLVDLLSAHADLAGVQVEPGWPGDTQKAESIWINSLSGSEEYPYMVGSDTRQVTDDRFDIPLQMRVANRKQLDETMQRLTELVAAVQDIVKDDPTLGLFAEGVLETDLGQADMTAGRMPEGVLGFARMVLAVHARLF